jgi:hypothetical protein
MEKELRMVGKEGIEQQNIFDTIACKFEGLKAKVKL